MKLIKIQKFYVTYLYKFPIDLSNTQINYEKHKAFGTINSLDLYELCQKISNDDFKINVKSLDAFMNTRKRKMKR